MRPKWGLNATAGLVTDFGYHLKPKRSIIHVQWTRGSKKSKFLFSFSKKKRRRDERRDAGNKLHQMPGTILAFCHRPMTWKGRCPLYRIEGDTPVKVNVPGLHQYRFWKKRGRPLFTVARIWPGIKNLPGVLPNASKRGSAIWDFKNWQGV